MTDNDDIMPDKKNDPSGVDPEPQGGPVENPSKLPAWDPEGVVADGIDEGDSKS